jgi:hypothetical protein
MNQNTTLSVLRAALSAIKATYEDGSVSAEAVTAIVAAVTLGDGILPPPVALPGRSPMTQKGVSAPAGSWPHFLRVLARLIESDYVASAAAERIEKCRKDAAIDRKMGEADRAERLEKEADSLKKEQDFYSFCLSAMRQALFGAIKRQEEVEQAQERATEKAKHAAEAKCKADAEAALTAEQKAELEAKRAKKLAALAALKSAATINVAAPVVLPVRGKVGEPARQPECLTPDGLREMVARAIKRNQEGGEARGGKVYEPMELEAAVSRAISWAMCIVLPSRSGLNPNELGALESAILDAGFAALHVPASNNSREAQQQAQRFLNDAKATRERNAKAKPREQQAAAPKQPKGKQPKGTLAEQLQARATVTAPGGQA